MWESLLPAEVLRLPEELARVDALLDDPVFFAPFAPFFDPLIGRPSTPMESYLRLMFLKFRYRLGFESLCAEVSDSITWRRFCRIPLDGTVPHPTTLMKLTTRCGSAAVDGLNEALLAKAAGAKLLRTTRLRADTTVVPGERGLPDRLGAAGQGGPPDRRDRAADPGRRRRDADPGAGPHPGGGQAGARDRGEAALAGRAGPGRDAGRGGAGRPGSSPTWPSAPPRRAAAAGQRAAGAAPRRREGGGPGRRRAADAAAGRRRGRLRRAVNDLAELLEATRQIAAQTRQRLAGTMPGRGDPAGQPARAGRPADRQGPARQAGRVRLQGPGHRQRRRRRRWTTPSSTATPPTPRSSPRPSNGSSSAPGASRGPSPPTAATARRPSTTPCTRLGVRHVVIPRKGKPGKARQAAEHRPAFRRTVKWRTGSEGRISTLKRGYGWDRTRLDGTEGARIWTGHGILAHNLVKISALAS